MKKTILFLSLLLSSIGVFAQNFTYGGLNYSVISANSHTCSVAINSEASGAVIIPESVTYNEATYTVTSITGRAFQNCTDITSVTIPSSITNIGYYVFQGCTGISSVTFNATNCSSMGGSNNYRVFLGCSNITQLTIGEGVTRIPSYAFSGCTGITNVDIPNSVSNIGMCAFDGCSSLTSVNIPNSVTSIGNSAFYNCSNLNRVNIPSSVTSISEGVFRYCSSLTSITIPESVTSIGNRAFQGCGLTSVTIPSSVQNVGEDAFAYCDYITNVVLNATNCSSMGTSGNPAFNTCNGIRRATIGEGVSRIPDYAFKTCRNLESLTIPSNVTIIGKMAFMACSRLNVAIPNSVTSIEEYAFNNCGLTNVTIPNSVTSIGNYAFSNSSRITSIVVPSSVATMGDDVFGACDCLNTIYDYRSDRSSGSYGLVPSRLVTVNDVDFSGTGVNQIVKIKSDSFTVSSSINNNNGIIPMAELPINHIGYDGSWKARSIVLTDSRTENNPFTCDEDFTATSVTYNRDFDDDRSSTVCLPFVITPAMRSAGNFKLHEFVSYNSSTGIATFSALSGETSSVANRPYIIEYNNAKGTFQMPTFSNVQFSATTSMSNPASSNGFHFEGTYDQRTMSNQNDTTFYGIYYGYFVRSNGEAKVNPFRGFFYTLDIPQGAPAPSGIDFQENEGNVGIELVDPSETIRYSNDVYDLSGRCVRKNADNLRGLSQGIYIWRGKKQLVH